jgi:Ca2+-binding RTX toxin-like protein
VIDNTGDKLVELSDGGNDTVRSSVSYSLEDTDGNGSNGGNIENLTLTGSANIIGIGNSLDNTITGNTGKNALNGGAGNDQLNGDAGNDIYLVVSAGDHTTAEIADTGSVSELDEVRFAATTLSGGGTLTLFAGDTGIELVVIGTGSAASAVTSRTTALNVDASAVLNGLTITGNAGANTLTGTGFNDILNGGAGIDTLVGGLGNDSLDGGSGADTLNGGDGDDIYIVDTDKDEIIDSSGTDTVKTTVNNYVLGNELENLTLIDGARIGTGNEFDNVIIGNAKNNVLDGGAGNDTLNGDGGNDIYLVVSAGDHTTAEIADTGSASEIDEVRFAATTLSGGNTLTLFAEDTGIERVVIGTGTAASAITSGTTALNVDASAVLKGLIITGNSGANTLTGTAKDDTLNGGAGIDTLVGGLGNDSLGGGVGADTLNGGDGDDTYFVDDNGDVIIDSSGIDTVNTSLLEYILTPDIENLTLLIGAYQGTGNDLENIITGNDGDNILNGDGGIDLLIGGAGNDMLVGGLGADTLVGGLGDDIYGVFLTSVGEMEDTVTEDTAAGSDTIKLAGTSSNLEAVTLRLSANLENLDSAATSASKLNLTGNALNNILTGNAADNILNGGSGNDILKGGNGNDSLYGGDGLDELTGGGGDDTFVFSTAVNKATNADTITDFVSTHDHIQLSKAIFTTLGDAGSLNSDFFYKGTAAHDATDHIIYDVNTGALYYDSDGNGTAAQVQIVTLTGKPSIVLGDFIVGA